MAQRLTTLHVLRTERLTPRMIRIVAGGPGLAGFPDVTYTDRYVKIVFPRSGIAYPEPFDLAVIRREMPRHQWPLLRTYTVRYLNFATSELAIDVVLHDGAGVAASWAAAARPGDVLRLLGPYGAYAPEPSAAWHLLVGDESALPAIAATLERLPSDSLAVVRVEVADAAEEQPLITPMRADVRWVHRDSAPPNPLVSEVVQLTFPPGEVHGFVHGEAGQVRTLRKHLVEERGIPRSHLSISGYWRRGRDEDGHRVG